MSFQSYFSLVKNCHLSIVGGLFLVFCVSCSNEAPEPFGPSNTRLIGAGQPEKLLRKFDLTDQLNQDLDRPENCFPLVRSNLVTLSQFIDSRIKKTVSQPSYEAPLFKYSGVDRATSKTTFSTSRIKVSRWRYTDSAPVFETDGLQNLLDNMYEPWAEATGFRTELKPTKILIEKEGQLNATVVARTFGEVRDNVGLESTSLWSTRWKIDIESREIELTELKILASEEVISSSTDGIVFRDITENVLQHGDVFKEHLGISMDEWANSIPGIDITGNLGIAIGDPNGDGFEDIYLCQPGGLPNVLLAQNPDGTADDIAQTANLDLLDESRAALFVDLDNDGDEDLVVSTSEELFLFSNNKGEFLLEHKLLSGHGGGSISAADYDNDGDLDLYVSKYNSIREEHDLLAQPDSFVSATTGGRNVLLKNEEGWTFVDVTDQVGLKENNIRHTRCGIWCDFDLDGDQDLVLANEYATDILYENRDGWFSDLAATVPAMKSQTASRSVSAGDFNGDGRFDFFIANNFHPASNQYSVKSEDQEPDGQKALFDEVNEMTSKESRILFSKPGNEKLFSSYQLPKPIFATGNSFGSVAMDINNDGFDDLMVTNGWFSKKETPPNEPSLASVYLSRAKSDQGIEGLPSLTERERLQFVTRSVADQIRQGDSFCDRQRNVCLLSMGAIGFANFSSAAGVDFMDDGRAIASTDWDHDGDLDLVVSSRTAPMLRVLGNQMKTENQFVGIQLKGTTSNRDAIGARVEMYLQGRNQPLIKSVTAGSGMLSQSSKRLHFGIPKDAKVSGILVYWPNGKKQSFRGIKPGTRYRIVEGQDEPAELTDTRFDIGLFKANQSPPSKKVTAKHCLLNPPMILPSLQFQGNLQTWVPLKTIDEMRMVVLFVDDSEDSSKVLRKFGEQARALADEKIDVVAVYLSDQHPNSNSSFAKASDLVENSNFPFRFGAASESMLLKLELLYGQWFSEQRLPQAPFGWIVDRENQVRVVYPSRKISVERVQNDLDTIDGNLQQCLDRFSIRPGYWVNPKRIVNYSRLNRRFEEIGFTLDQDVFAKLSNRHLANQLCRRAVELEAQGNGDKAREAYSKALEKDPRCEMACVEFGNLRVRDVADVIDNVKRLSMLNEAELLFDRAIRINPTNTKAILGRARVLISRKKLDEAISQLKEFLEIYPERWEVHAEVGRIYYRKQEYAKATEYLLTAWKARPNLTFLAGDLGFIYLNKGRYKDARSFFRFANRLQPSQLVLKRCLAQSEFMTGNYDIALGILQELVELAPNEPLLKKMQAWILATSPFETQRDGEKSLAIIKPMIEIYDDSAVIREIAAAAYAELGDFENALLHQQKASDFINEQISKEPYSRSRLDGLYGRLELYKRKRPYRMEDLDQIPLPAPGLE